MDGFLRSVCRGVCLALLLSSPLCSQEIDRELRSRFSAAVKETESKLERLSFRVNCTYSSKFVWASDEVLTNLRKTRKEPYEPRTQEFDFAVNGESTLQKTGPDGTKIENVLGMNDRYAFHVQRGNAVKQYSLAFLEPLGSAPLEDDLIRQECRSARVLPLCTWIVAGLTVSELVQSPYFRITRLSSVPPIQSDGAELVRIEFDHLVDDQSRKRREWMSDGYMVCDPSKSWALTEYCVTLEDGSVYHVTLEFGELIDGFPIAERMTRVITAENISTRQAVATFELISDDVPVEEFYLSHYGLPEPTFRRSWLGAWVWYLIAGVGCLVVSAIVLKRQKAAG